MEYTKEGGSRTTYELGGREVVQEPVAEGWRQRYVFTPRLVGRLALGELAVEPVLGVVRVAGVRHGEGGEVEARASDAAGANEFVHVTWRDEHGPNTATGRYSSSRSFDVRMPDLADRLLVRRGIDQAVWHGREITDDTARLIASHLHSGMRSALDAFMVDGSIDEGLYDELDVVAAHRLYAREWVDALARYCLNRGDTGPVLAWTRAAVNEAETRAEEWLTAAGVNVSELAEHVNGNGNHSANGNGAGGDGRKRYPGLGLASAHGIEFATVSTSRAPTGAAVGYPRPTGSDPVTLSPWPMIQLTYRAGGCMASAPCTTTRGYG